MIIAFLMYGKDILCGISKVPFEIPHKTSFPYIKKGAVCFEVKLLDLQAHTCFWNALLVFYDECEWAHLVTVMKSTLMFFVGGSQLIFEHHNKGATLEMIFLECFLSNLFLFDDEWICAHLVTAVTDDIDNVWRGSQLIHQHNDKGGPMGNGIYRRHLCIRSEKLVFSE